MAKTITDTVARAHREIRVLSVDRTPSADQVAYGAEVLQGIYDEHKGQLPDLTWDLSAIPDNVFSSLSKLLAAELASHYNKVYMSPNKAWVNFRGVINPSNLPDRRDLDGDGNVDENEEWIGEKARYF